MENKKQEVKKSESDQLAGIALSSIKWAVIAFVILVVISLVFGAWFALS